MGRKESNQTHKAKHQLVRDTSEIRQSPLVKQTTTETKEQGPNVKRQTQSRNKSNNKQLQ